MNSALGIYIISEYPHLHETHPNIYRYLLYFSAKWVLCLVASFAFLLTLQLCFKLLCCAKDVCHNTIGAFPIIYLSMIILSYFASLYYGVLILREMFAPMTTEEDQEYAL